jgi:hypothetical protein
MHLQKDLITTYRLAGRHKIALSDSDQRAVLIMGIELALYIRNRLKVYLDTFACLSPSLATENFRKNLVDLYVHILAFLAHAIRIQEKANAVRVLRVLWDFSVLEHFEEECDKLCIRASEEARFCDCKIQERWKETMSDSLQTLDKINGVKDGLVKLQDKADLAKLITAKDATFDSSIEGGLPRCLPGTRTNVLWDIRDWIADPYGKLF